MKAQDLRNMSVEDLNKSLGEQRKELFNLRFKHSTAQLEKTHEIPATKRNIAKIMTILKEKEA